MKSNPRSSLPPAISLMVSRISVSLFLCIMKKSLSFPPCSGNSPLFMRCELVTMRLSSACLNISLSLVVCILSLAIMSRRTLPAPTDGSWSASPVNMSRVPVFTASRSPSISMISIIEASSTMMTSCSSGFSSFLPKLSMSSSSEYTYSRSRWMVIAGLPVASSMRFAARPVGAASATLSPSLANILTRILSIVVLPVPGPPVIIETLLASAAYTASIWSPDRDILIPSASMPDSASLMRLSGDAARGAASALRILERLYATLCSA